MKNYISNLRIPFRKGRESEADDPRKYNLELHLPRLGAKPKAFDTHSKKIESHLASYANESTHQLIEALKYIEQLNKIHLKLSQRTELTQSLLKISARSLADTYRKYVSKGNSFPETTERKTALTTCIYLLQNLIISYKVILSETYTLPLKKFSFQQDSLAMLAVRIIELNMWLQRFLAIRFQKLSTIEWRDCNRIFTLYASLFDAGKVLPLTDNLELYKASGILSEKNSKNSVNSLYLMIQIFGQLDISSWPSNAQQIIEQYLEKHADLMQIKFAVSPQAGDDFILTYADRSGPPVFNDEKTDASVRCYIDISGIKQQVKDDIKEIQRKQFIGIEEKKRIQPNGTVKDLAEHAALLALLSKNLTEAKRHEDRKNLYGAKVIQLYTGLAAVYKLLYDIVHEPKDNREDNVLQNAIAKHSSLLMDGEADVLECQWRSINESSHGILVRTVETKYMHALEVGQLIALRNDDTSAATPLLGFITRLERLNEGEVDVAIVKLSDEADAVIMLEPGQENATQDVLPAILMRKQNGEWQVILPRHVKYVTGTPAIIKKQNEHIPVRLGDTVTTRNGFVLFEVRSPSLE